MIAQGGLYKVEQGNLTGYVKAYNKISAEAQMKWVKEHQTCFCKSCVEDLARDYLVYLEASSIKVSDFIKGGIDEKVRSE